MTNLRIVALRALLAIMVGSVLTGCLPIGFRGQSIYIVDNAPLVAGH